MGVRGTTSSLRVRIRGILQLTSLHKAWETPKADLDSVLVTEGSSEDASDV